MAARQRIRRKLTLNVSEPRTHDINDPVNPGVRFATGWQLQRGIDGLAECAGDPIKIAGYLAAQAAWDAHHYATNWIAT